MKRDLHERTSNNRETNTYDNCTGTTRAHSYLVGIRIMSKETYINEKRPTKETYIYRKCTGTKTHTFVSHRYSYHVKKDLDIRKETYQTDQETSKITYQRPGCMKIVPAQKRAHSYSYHVKKD